MSPDLDITYKRLNTLGAEAMPVPETGSAWRLGT
jgi:hypothetical protein